MAKENFKLSYYLCGWATTSIDSLILGVLFFYVSLLSILSFFDVCSSLVSFVNDFLSLLRIVSKRIQIKKHKHVDKPKILRRLWWTFFFGSLFRFFLSIIYESKDLRLRETSWTLFFLPKLFFLFKVKAVWKFCHLFLRILQLVSAIVLSHTFDDSPMS